MAVAQGLEELCKAACAISFAPPRSPWSYNASARLCSTKACSQPAGPCITCTSRGANRIDCFTRGKNRRIYQVRWDGVSWGMFDMGPLPTSGAADNQYLGVGAAAYASNALFLLVIGVDGNLYYRKWDGASWGVWRDGGKASPDNLMTVSCQAGVIYLMDCVFGDVGGKLWHRSYYDGGGYWLDWHNLNAVGGGINAYYASGVGTCKIVGDPGALML